MTDPTLKLDKDKLDAISLAQALQDFETANARVLDLTQRLLASEKQRKDLADELERLRLQLATQSETISGVELRRKLTGAALQKARGAVERAKGLARKATRLLGS